MQGGARPARPKRDVLGAVRTLVIRLFIEVAPNVGALSAADCASGSALYALLAKLEPRVVRVPAIRVEMYVT